MISVRRNNGMLELLKKLSETSGVSGNEENIAKIVREELSGHADEIFTDNLGNLIVHKKGSGKKLMFSAHMDEIGLMATYIEDNRFVRFAPVGGVGINTILGKTVTFANGTRGVVAYESAIDIKKELDFKKLYIDVFSDGGAEKVAVGDMAVIDGEFMQNGNFVTGRALDNRIGVCVLAEAVKAVESSDFDLYFVFSSQEEIGLRGARTAAFEINPDYAVSVDVTDTGDTPNCPKNSVVLGKGAAVKIMDKSVICHPKVRRALQKCAASLGMSVQSEVLSYGGTDAGSIHMTGDGVATGALSVPLRYMHTAVETAAVSDIEDCIKLVTEFAAHNYID